MPLKGGLITARERMVARAAAITGEDAAEIARRAGYADESGARKALERPAVRALMVRELMTRLASAGEMAVGVLVKVMSSEHASDGQKIRAAEVTLKYALRPGEGADDKAPSEMTGDEMAEAIQRLRKELADRAKPIIDQEPDVFG